MRENCTCILPYNDSNDGFDNLGLILRGDREIVTRNLSLATASPRAQSRSLAKRWTLSLIMSLGRLNSHLTIRGITLPYRMRNAPCDTIRSVTTILLTRFAGAERTSAIRASNCTDAKIHSSIIISSNLTIDLFSTRLKFTSLKT